MLNNIIIMGRLVADPAVRYTKDQIPVASFRVAVDRDYGEETDFIDVTAWRKTAEFVSKFFRKGSMAVVTGRLQMETWEKDGQRRTSYGISADRVYFGERKRDQNDGFNDDFDDGPLPWD